MPTDSQVIEAPLSQAQLAQRYRELCDNPLFNNIPGKIEIDLWGRLLFLPFSAWRGLVLGRLGSIFPTLGGESFVSVSVLTAAGVLVADFGWASNAFMRAHDYETPLTEAPEICVETASSFNSAKELREKIDAYLAAGAEEVWIAYLESKRCEFHGKQGAIARSAYPVDLGELFK
jgi:hypothetical protein